MLDTNTKLTVMHDANGSFTDLSFEAFDFSRDTFSVTLNASTSYLYVGFTKPINTIYISTATANTNANTLTIEYYNGSWTSVDNKHDATKGLTRSGYMTWDRPTDATQTAINSTTKYWVRIRPSVTHSATSLNGIGLVFCDGIDLAYEVPEINDSNHLAGKTSHILNCVASTNQIIQDFRNKDYSVTNPSTGVKEDLTAWDLLDINQVKQAAVFLTLSKIYFNFSDSPEDKYSDKSNYYYKRYQDAIGLSRLSLDTDKDGIADSNEVNTEFKTLRIRR
jgi:hypothetical protein